MNIDVFQIKGMGMRTWAAVGLHLLFLVNVCAAGFTDVTSSANVDYLQWDPLQGNLESLRITGGAAAGCTGTAGTGAVNTEAAFLEQLTRYTDENGVVCSKSEAGFIFGPYFKKRPHA